MIDPLREPNWTGTGGSIAERPPERIEFGQRSRRILLKGIHANGCEFQALLRVFRGSWRHPAGSSWSRRLQKNSPSRLQNFSFAFSCSARLRHSSSVRRFARRRSSSNVTESEAASSGSATPMVTSSFMSSDRLSKFADPMMLHASVDHRRLRVDHGRLVFVDFHPLLRSVS